MRKAAKEVQHLYSNQERFFIVLSLNTKGVTLACLSWLDDSQ